MVGACMLIYIHTLTDETIELDVERDELVESVKDRIHHIEGVSPNQQRLMFAGQELQDRHTLGDSKIKPNSVLNLVLR
jgi:ubiquitin-large subunit ribosomal protein L40e